MAKATGELDRTLLGYNITVWPIVQVYTHSDFNHGPPLNFKARWRKVNDTWLCALHGRVLSLRQDSTHLHYRASYPDNSLDTLIPPSSVSNSTGSTIPGDDDTEALVQHYLNLSPDLTELYEQWSGVDTNFKKKAPKFAGIRILKQDAWEALMGFICSSNNNIIRISQMVRFKNRFLSLCRADRELF